MKELFASYTRHILKVKGAYYEREIQWKNIRLFSVNSKRQGI